MVIRSYGFWGTFFKNVIVPVSLGVVAFFAYRTIDGRIVVLERDVKGLDLLGKYKNLEMKLESNILYNGNITSQLNKNITEIRKDVVSLFEELNQLKSSIVTLGYLEDKISEMKSSFVTSDCLEEKINEMKSYINKTLEDFKLYTNSGEVTTGEDDYDADEKNEDEKDVLPAATPASDGTGENRGAEDKECKDNKEDDGRKTNIVAEGKSKTESNDEEVFDNEDKTPNEDLDTGLEEYDGYNDDIFFNDTDNKQKDIITQPQEQSDNKSAGNYNNRNDYNRDKEVVDLIQSLEQAKRRVDDLEGIVSKYEKGYSLFKLQMCFGPSITWLGKLLGFEPFKELQPKNALPDDKAKFSCSFFLNLPFSRILPMISYHCLFYKKTGNNIENEKKDEENKEKAENIILNKKDNVVGGNISEKENIDTINIDINIKPEQKEEENIDLNEKGRKPSDSLETSPTMFCVSLLRIIKTSLFFLDFGLKIYYPNKPDENAGQIVENFWNEFIGTIFTIKPWGLFLGFNLGPQLLFFFSFSLQDCQRYKIECDNYIEGRKHKGRILLKKILDNFKIELRLLEVSI